MIGFTTSHTDHHLKSAADELAPALALLFKLSMVQGEIPQDWKKTLVVPIFKKGDKHQPSNYRPFSLTSITCKLLEHIIHSNIMHHFDQHRALCDNQHGFRKKPTAVNNTRDCLFNSHGKSSGHHSA